MAQILGERFLRITFCLVANENEEMEAEDDNLSEEEANFLSITRQLGAANEPSEDMAVKLDAIYFSSKAENNATINKPKSIHTKHTPLHFNHKTHILFPKILHQKDKTQKKQTCLHFNNKANPKKNKKMGIKG
jgi:hypothetical protein